MTPTETGPRCALYRFFDAAGNLLYAGITNDLLTRWSHHERQAEWWPLAERITVDWYPDRESAAAAELLAIREEGPLWNVAGRGETPRQTFRVEPAVWRRFGELARAAGTNRSKVLMAFIEKYVADRDGATPGDTADA